MHYGDFDADSQPDSMRDEYDYWVNVCQAVVSPPKVNIRSHIPRSAPVSFIPFTQLYFLARCAAH